MQSTLLAVSDNRMIRLLLQSIFASNGRIMPYISRLARQPSNATNFAHQELHESFLNFRFMVGS
jgi:hypothetical protein